MNSEEFDTPTQRFDSSEQDAPETADAHRIAARQRPPIRMGTIVWGLIIVALGTLIIMWDQGVKIHPQVAGVAVLFGAGALLILGSIITAIRKNGDDHSDS